MLLLVKPRGIISVGGNVATITYRDEGQVSIRTNQLFLSKIT